MEVEQFCPQHQKQRVSWVCLERVCHQRIMCSSCAVKLHERSHKLEELSTIQENGILDAYVSNPKNQSFGLKLLCDGFPEIIRTEEPNHEDYLAQSIERCLKAVSRRIDSSKKELQFKQDELKGKQDNERTLIIKEISLYDTKIQMANNIGQDIDLAFQTITTFVQKKEQEALQSKDAEILIKKIQLLTLMKENFQKMIKTYFSNAFTADFCQLFDMQLETLNQKEVQDVNGFLDYVDGKWKQDYKNIQYSIERFVQKLNEGLKYAIQLPLEEKKMHVYKSPQKQHNNQQYITSPFMPPASPYMQPIPQPVYYQYHQPQPQPLYHVVSPKTHDDYMIKSQILYEEPSKKGIKIEPVSQSLQYQ